MALPPPSKIVLKSTTRLSLNERFSAYRKQAENSAVAVRQRLQTMQQNSKNWRLIQQMENRPSVIAALKIKKRSLKQRLGQPPRKSVKERLSLGVIGTGRLGMRSTRFRGGIKGRFSRRGKLRGRRPQLTARATSGGSWSLAENSRLQGRLGTRLGHIDNAENNLSGGSGIRNRLGRGLEFRRGQGAKNSRGGFQVGRGRGQYFSPKLRTNIVTNRRSEQSSRGRGRGKQKSTPSRQTLDNELDEYMSRTKGNLDMEIDSYMAETNLD
ncbi:hypothetical protein CHUAL_000945 [Chamberlinius hualienensis]